MFRSVFNYLINFVEFHCMRLPFLWWNGSQYAVWLHSEDSEKQNGMERTFGHSEHVL